jgi:hypothetical protein
MCGPISPIWPNSLSFAQPNLSTQRRQVGHGRQPLSRAYIFSRWRSGPHMPDFQQLARFVGSLLVDPYGQHLLPELVATDIPQPRRVSRAQSGHHPAVRASPRV